MRISWKSFLLKGGDKSPDREKFVNYTQGWQGMAELEPRLNFQPWSSEDDPPTGSLVPQIAHKAVLSEWPERAMEMHHRLLEAYFSENRTVSDWSVLAELVSSIGEDPNRFLSIIEESRELLANDVISEHNEAINQGITAVPTVLINSVLPVPGAQESETYINWIERIIERSENT